MPRRIDFPPDDEVLDQTDPLTPGARFGWWGGYVLLVMLAFCFGVWAGNQRPKPVEQVAAPTEKAHEPTPEPSPKKEIVPEPKKTPGVKQPELKPPETKQPEPKPTPDAVPPEPKKAPEPKTTPEPKSPAVKEVIFVKDVLPIFKSKCNLCHGDTKGLKGELDLRTVAAITKGGDNGPGVKAGDLKTGTVWAAIEDGSMPPAGKEQLTDAEKLIVRNWILSGAK